MKIDLEKLETLIQHIANIQMLDPGENPLPWSGAAPLTADLLVGPLGEGADFLPIAYWAAFVGPLRASLKYLVRSHDDPGRIALNAETLVGAVYQHSEHSAVRYQLRQFLAVISNYYRSFLSGAKRKALDLPPALGGLPPLATFRHQGNLGPFTFPADMVKKLCGAEVAVVSLPERLRFHPACWLTLAHETAGHDVLHADPTLLPDLVAGVRSLFGGGPLTPGREPDDDQTQALLWSYWVDEVASDVYALLNSGPAFAYNLAAFLAGLRVHRPGLAFRLDRPSRWDPLDTHPTAALRLHVAIGVVENLAGLAPADRRKHVANLRALASHEAAPRVLLIRGRVEIERDRWADLDRPVPFMALAQAGRRVGAFIATTRLRAFGGRSIQDIETWDADDERIAVVIAQALVARDTERVKILGDDAQLLAGATLALLEEPSLYDDINVDLSLALLESFRRDPILGFASAHAAFAFPLVSPPDAQPMDDPRTASAAAGVGGPPSPVPQPDVTPVKTSAAGAGTTAGAAAEVDWRER